MNPLIKLVDDSFLMQIYSGLLRKNDSISISRFYADYVIDHISIRRANENIGDRPIIQIQNDLSILFDENYISIEEQKKVKDYLIGWGFPIK
jgi:hypothetical protein